ncbi:MAG: insulinase family protein [Ignavibacteria bacterium]|nr:insulinase family protein [Ignavibacteria bacterium]
MQKSVQNNRSTYNPKVHELANGVRVVCDTVTSVDSCAVGVFVGTGTRDDPKGLGGTAHFVEHTSFRRTTTKNSKAIAREFENVGAYANAYTTKEETSYYVRALRQSVPKVFATLADVIINPVFDAADVEKERLIISEEIRSYEDEAEEFILDAAEQQIFNAHPLGLPIVGTLKSVSRISSTSLQKFHKAHYNASNIVVCASGNVQPQELIELTEKLFSGLPRSNKHVKRLSPKRLKPSELIFHKPLQQTHIAWHTQTSGFRSRSNSKLMLLNIILGDGMMSRLNVRIREGKGLAYNIYSQLQTFSDCGIFSVYAGTEVASAGKAQLMIEQELNRLAMNGVTRTELVRAKEQLRAGKIMSLESLSARLSMLGRGVLEDGKPEDPYKFIHAADKVTLEEVNEIARKILRSDSWSKCVIVPGKSEE